MPLESWMIPLAITKGLLMMAVIMGLAETGFLESLAIAACSATITGSFLVIATVLGNRRTTHKVEDLKSKVEEATIDGQQPTSRRP